MGSCCGLDTLPGRFPSVSPHKHQLPSNSWFARLAPVQAPLRVYPHTSYSTVPPCLQDEVRSTREQDNSDTRRPKNRSGVARRHFRRSVEQLAVAKGASMTPKCASACTSILSLVSSVTGGSRPGHVPGSSGVVPPGAICRALAPNAPLSEQPLTRLFSVYAILMGTLYHLGVKMSRGVERHCQTKSLPCVKGGGPTQVGSEGLSGPRYRQPLSQP